MLDYRKIDALMKDRERATRLARILLGAAEAPWTDWELDFLQNLAARSEPLTTRQSEKLLELEEASVWVEKVPGHGFSVRLLVRACHLARLDLEQDDDVAFIEDLQTRGVSKLRRRGVSRLLRCARELGVIEGYAGAAPAPDPLAA